MGIASDRRIVWLRMHRSGVARLRKLLLVDRATYPRRASDELTLTHASAPEQTVTDDVDRHVDLHADHVVDAIVRVLVRVPKLNL